MSREAKGRRCADALATTGASDRAATRAIRVSKAVSISANTSGGEPADHSRSPLLLRRCLVAAARRLEPARVPVVRDVQDREAGEGGEVDEHAFVEVHRACQASDRAALERALCRQCEVQQRGMHLARSRRLGQRLISARQNDRALERLHQLKRVSPAPTEEERRARCVSARTLPATGRSHLNAVLDHRRTDSPFRRMDDVGPPSDAISGRRRASQRPSFHGTALSRNRTASASARASPC